MPPFVDRRPPVIFAHKSWEHHRSTTQRGERDRAASIKKGHYKRRASGAMPRAAKSIGSRLKIHANGAMRFPMREPSGVASVGMEENAVADLWLADERVSSLGFRAR